MAILVNMHDAKSQLSKLAAKAAAGEEIVIARDGKPLARLVKLKSKPARRKIGLDKGKIWMPDDFIEARVPGFEEFYD